jgi:hypothetical protein
MIWIKKYENCIDSLNLVKSSCMLLDSWVSSHLRKDRFIARPFINQKIGVILHEIDAEYKHFKWSDQKIRKRGWEAVVSY